MKKYVVAVDKGSTNVKAIAYDFNGDAVASARVGLDLPKAPKPGWWEQDMNEMWEAARDAIKELMTKIDANDVAGVITTGQGNGLLALDKEDNPVRPGVLSSDARAHDIIEDWKAKGIFDKVNAKFVLPIYTGSLIPIIAWFKKFEPETYAKMDKLLFSKDWIRYKLSKTFCTDQTDASGGSMMDVAKNRYAYDCYDLLGLEDLKDKLPEICPSHQVVGEVTKEAALETGLIEGTKVLCGVHDMGAFPYGVGSMDSDEMVLVMGTFGINIVPGVDPLCPVYFQHSVPGYLLSGLGDPNSGGCLNLIVKNFCELECEEAKRTNRTAYEVIEDRVEKGKKSGIIFHPFIFGSVFNSQEFSGIYGLKTWHTREDILRAIYEGIIFGHYKYCHAIQNLNKLKKIYLIGGGAQSKIFGQLIADVFKVQVVITVDKEITARGAALNALVGIGVYKNHEEGCIPAKIDKTYTPNPDMYEYYDSKFQLFCMMSDKLGDTLGLVNKLNTEE